MVVGFLSVFYLFQFLTLGAGVLWLMLLWLVAVVVVVVGVGNAAVEAGGVIDSVGVTVAVAGGGCVVAGGYSCG